jgi:hypothetical protein
MNLLPIDEDDETADKAAIGTIDAYKCPVCLCGGMDVCMREIGSYDGKLCTRCDLIAAQHIYGGELEEDHYLTDRRKWSLRKRFILLMYAQFHDRRAVLDNIKRYHERL